MHSRFILHVVFVSVMSRSFDLVSVSDLRRKKVGSSHGLEATTIDLIRL